MPNTATTAAKSTVIKIKVHFELITKDKLRKVIFGLEKDSPGDKVIWKIIFQLAEREKKTDPFSENIVDIEFEVDKQLNSNAENTALKGMTAFQQAHALGPAANDQKAAEAGEISQKKANKTTQDTLKK